MMMTPPPPQVNTIRGCLHDAVLLGGHHQDVDLHRHPHLLPYKVVGDFQGLEGELLRASTSGAPPAEKKRVARAVCNQVDKQFRSLEWTPLKRGAIDRDDPTLARIRRAHGDEAAELFVRELERVAEANGLSGGYAVVVEWDHANDRRMPTNVAVAQLTRQYAALREATVDMGSFHMPAQCPIFTCMPVRHALGSN